MAVNLFVLCPSKILIFGSSSFSFADSDASEDDDEEKFYIYFN